MLRIQTVKLSERLWVHIFSGLQILKSLNREEEEKANGVLAICISSVPFQPYISLAAIISVSFLACLKFIVSPYRDAQIAEFKRIYF